MDSLIKNIYKYILVCCCFANIFGCSSGGGDGGNGDQNNPSVQKTTTISGFVIKGPIANATVNAYSVTNGLKYSIIATTKSSEYGSYSLDVTDYNGTVLLEAIGGTYLDEASGEAKTLTESTGDGLTAVLSLSSSSNSVSVNITPLTSFIVSMAQYSAGGLTQDNITLAESTISKYFNLSDVHITSPINPLSQDEITGASQNQIDYGLILAGFSFQALSLGLTDPMQLVHVLGIDIQDGMFDGKNSGIEVKINDLIILSNTAITTDLATAIVSFAGDSIHNIANLQPSTELINHLNGEDSNNKGNNGISPPKNITFITEARKITIKWSSVANADSYNIYYSTSHNIDTTTVRPINVPGSSTGLTVGSLQPETTYYFVIITIIGAEQSPPSMEYSVTTEAVVPNIYGKYSANSISEQRENCSNPDDNGTLIYDSALLFINSQNNSVFSGTLSLKSIIQGELSIVSLQLHGTSTVSNALTGSFTSSKEVNGAVLFSSSGSFSGQVTDNTVSLNIQGTDLSTANCSAMLDIILSANVPATPANVSLVSGDASNSLTWDVVENATGYYIYWRVSNTVPVNEQTVFSTTAAYVHDKLIVGYNYTYSVVANNQVGSSSKSNEVSAKGVTVIHPGDIIVRDENPFIEGLATGNAEGTPIGKSIVRIDPQTNDPTVIIAGYAGPFALDSNNEVVFGKFKINPTNGNYTVLCCNTSSSDPRVITAVALSTTDDVYITTSREQNFQTNHYFGRIDPSTQTYIEIGYISSAYEAIGGMAVDSNGDVVIVGDLSYFNGNSSVAVRALRIDPITGSIEPVYYATTEMGLPSAIVFDADDNFYLSFGENDSIIKVFANSVQSEIASLHGAVRRAMDMVIDGDGNLVVADYGSKYGAATSIKIIDPSTQAIVGRAGGAYMGRLTHIRIAQ